MPQDSREPFYIIRKLLPYTTVAAVLALLYVGWVFYGRSTQNHELQREADQKDIDQARKTYELYGSGQLKILQFYAVPAVVHPGATTQLCYGVSNATTVKMEPGVGEIKPSLNHCLQIKPSHSITYTLTASDDQGHSTSQSTDVVIR